MNIVIVGLGSMGKRRARLMNGLEAGHCLFGVDMNAKRRSEAKALGITVFASLPEALAAGVYDAAFVCTAPLSHAALIEVLLDVGLPVFTELNLVADGYERLAQKVKEKEVPLFVSSTMLYRAETVYIARSIEKFAKPVNYIYHIGQYLPDWHPWENYRDFFVGDARTSGVREILAIDLPWLVSAFGPVAAVQVQQNRLTDLQVSYKDSCYIMLKHENGTQGFLAADVVSPKAVRRFEVFGEGLHIFWDGNPKSLFQYDGMANELRPVDTYAGFEHDPRYSDNIVENAYVEEILNFFEVLEGRGTARWSLEKDLAVLCLIDEIERGGKGATG